MMDFKCMVCGKPYVVKEFQGFNSRPLKLRVPDCDCEEKLLKTEAERAAKLQVQEMARARIKMLHLPRIYENQTLDNLTCENLESARNYVNEFKPFKSKGILLFGGNGNGKSTLAVAMCKKLAVRGFKIEFSTFSDVLTQMEQGWGATYATAGEDVLERLLARDFIVFDDFGREKYTDRRLENVFLIFDKLYTNMNSLAITANPESLAKLSKMPEFAPIMDRFSQMLDTWNFKASSYRRMATERR